jgi:uncharacterized low-complexity protein
MNKKLLSIAVGTTFAASVTAGTAVASENPFGMSELDSGYQIAMSIMPEGSCGEKGEEGKCGEGKAKEGKCGDKKAPEGKCGGM